MPRPIYTFGDSHALNGWKELPDVFVKTFGPRTMYRAGQEKEVYAKIIPADVIMCFCYGEVDCRCNVHKYQPWKEDIDAIVVEYLDMIRLNAEINPDVWIYNVLPPPRKEGALEVIQYPFLGTDDERLAYVRYMNEKLRQAPYTFVDIYEKYADKEGFLLTQLSDGHVHIRDATFLREWVEAHR